MASRLPMAKRLSLLAAFNVSVYLSYIAIIQRSKGRGGDLQRDGYSYWDMWKPPAHIRKEN